MTDKNDFTSGSIVKKLILYFLPIWMGVIFQQFYTTADAIIVGTYAGKAALAALGGTTSLLVDLTIGFFIGASAGGGVAISHCFGAKDFDRLKYAIREVMVLAVGCGAVLSVVGFVCTPWALRMMNAPEDVMGPALIYLRIYYCGAIFSLIYNMGSAVLRALGDSKRPLMYLILASVINIVLDIVLVAICKLGAGGAAFATIFAQAVCAVLIIYQLTHADEEVRLSVAPVKAYPEIFRKIIVLSVPLGLQYTMYTCSNLVIQALVNVYGTDWIAGWTVLLKMDGIFWFTMTAFGTAVTGFVGQNYGAGLYDRMKKSVRYGTAILLGLTVSITALLLVFAKPIVALFTKDPDVTATSLHFIKLLVPTYWTYIFTELYGGVMKGAGNSMAPLIFTGTAAFAIRSVVAVAISRMWPGIDTLVMSYPISWIISSLMFTIYYFWGRWMPEIDIYRRKN